MTEHRGLTGLRAAAEETLLADLRVTPELKAQVLSRIAAGAAAPPPAHRPTRRRLDGAGWAVAAVATLVLVALAANQPGGLLPVRRESAHQAAMSDAGGNAVDSYDLAPQGAQAAGAPKLAISAASTGSQVSVRLTDQNGARVPGAAEVQPGQKIIVNGEYGLEVKDVREAVDRLRSLTTAAGGYVAEASIDSNPGAAAHARLVLRIPSAGFAGATQELRSVGQVRHEREWTQDVTDQYMDLEHRIGIQQEQEKRLRELATKAASFDDWNKLTTQMNETRAQVENMQGRFKLLRNQVDYAIVTVTLQQPGPGQVSLLPNNPTLTQQLGQSFVRSWHALTALGRRTVVGLAGLVPWALVLLPVAAVAWLLWRRRRPPGAAM